MTDFRVAAYECYLSAWAAVSDAQRLSLLREGVTQGVIFSNSTRTRTGIADVVDHLEGFQRGSPGGSFRLLSMLGWDDNALAKWQFVGADGIRQGWHDQQHRHVRRGREANAQVTTAAARISAGARLTRFVRRGLFAMKRA
jgi:SnoaL-like domain